MLFPVALRRLLWVLFLFVAAAPAQTTQPARKPPPQPLPPVVRVQQPTPVQPALTIAFDPAGSAVTFAADRAGGTRDGRHSSATRARRDTARDERRAALRERRDGSRDDRRADDRERDRRRDGDSGPVTVVRQSGDRLPGGSARIVRNPLAGLDQPAIFVPSRDGAEVRIRDSRGGLTAAERNRLLRLRESELRRSRLHDWHRHRLHADWRWRRPDPWLYRSWRYDWGYPYYRTYDYWPRSSSWFYYNSGGPSWVWYSHGCPPYRSYSHPRLHSGLSLFFRF